MKRAYVSGLGVMGRRHAVALARKGYAVDGFDPSADAFSALLTELDRLGLPKAVQHVGAPSGHYDAAVFSEHADLRFANIAAFLGKASAGRLLIEKPLSSDPEEVERLPALLARHGVKPGQVAGNFTRRAWQTIQRIKALCDGATQISMTVHGGAYGLGGNGIHYMDLFLYLTGDQGASVRSSRLFEVPIRSGRGERFADYGGHVVLEAPRGLMTALCVPTSSVAPLIMISGEHFAARIDERTPDWELAVRKPGSALPVYRCGSDYEVVEAGPMAYIPMDQVAGLWADGDITLPDLGTVMAAHRLLTGVLEAGGATPPYRYT